MNSGSVHNEAAAGQPGQTGSAILVMAKAPEAGRVKTRQCPPLTFEQARDLHEALLLDTLDLVRAAATVRMLACAGPPDWFDTHAPDFERFAQQGADLGERLHAALQAVLAAHTPVLCVGSDSPHISAGCFERAFFLLQTHPVVLGPARDGGYYLVGLRTYHDLFRGMPMSTDRLFAATLERCRELDLEVGLLDVAGDFDTWQDVCDQAHLLADGHTRRLLAQLSIRPK